MAKQKMEIFKLIHKPVHIGYKTQNVFVSFYFMTLFRRDHGHFNVHTFLTEPVERIAFMPRKLILLILSTRISDKFFLMACVAKNILLSIFFIYCYLVDFH